MSEVKYKQFRSVGAPLRIDLPTGHMYTLFNEFIPLPQHVWAEAYSLGAVSEDVKNEDLNDYIKEKVGEAEEALLEERQKAKDILKVAFQEPFNLLDKNNKLIHRKAIALVGFPIKRDMLDEIWNELIEESEG